MTRCVVRRPSGYSRRELKVTLLPQEKKAIETRGTSNVAAYNAYLMARDQWA
jgi:adenylate cyclase